jgi:hypothetical protein
MFESIFEDFTKSLVKDHNDRTKLHRKKMDELDRELKEFNITDDDLLLKDDEDDHIELKEVKDITNHTNIGENTGKVVYKELKENKMKSDTTDTSNKEITKHIVQEEHIDQPIALKFDPNPIPNKDDNIMTPKERKKKIKEEKKKNFFAKICKYIFYSIGLFSIYVVVKRLLQLIGIIEHDPKKYETPQENNSSINSANEGVELKSSNIKHE